MTEAPKRPKPSPPVDKRPKQLSVTRIETLIRDPYDIYARSVLKLRPFEPLGKTPDAAERGTLIHDILEAFVRERPAGPYDAVSREAPSRDRPRGVPELSRFSRGDGDLVAAFRKHRALVRAAGGGVERCRYTQRRVQGRDAGHAGVFADLARRPARRACRRPASRSSTTRPARRLRRRKSDRSRRSFRSKA